MKPGKTLIFASGIVSISLIALNGVAEIRQPDDVDVETLKTEYLRPENIPFPENNQYTAGKYDLGHKLFFDPRMSGSGVISCATCHNPGLGWEDGLSKGLGHMGARLGRHTPTVINLAWGELFFWDGRATSLEEQALGPIESDVEMNMSLDTVLEHLSSIEFYRNAFAAEFPGEGLTKDNIAKAIATFERTLVSNYAPFDHWVEGDEDAISESAKRGFLLFNTKANCSVCHTGWRFTDDGFHDIGVDDDDVGRGSIIPIPVLKNAFKTPTLRNIDQRKPYLHDGSAADLMSVVEHYNSGFVQRDTLSAEVFSLGLTEQEKRDLVAFMKTLTSEDDPIPVPVLPQ